jgi:hypothetical protein
MTKKTGNPQKYLSVVTVPLWKEKLADWNWSLWAEKELLQRRCFTLTKIIPGGASYVTLQDYPRWCFVCDHAH